MKLEELLNLYDFKFYREDLRLEEDKTNCSTIRVYLDGINWFEFGINEWYAKKEKSKNIKNILSKELLNRKVASFSINIDMNMVVIYLD